MCDHIPNISTNQNVQAGLPQQDDYGLNNAFAQNTASQPASRSTQQSYPTAYTPAQTAFYRATAAAAADYSAVEGYQPQAFGQRQAQQSQQRPVNEAIAYSSQWYAGSGGGARTTASTGNEGPANSTTMNQKSTGNSNPGSTGGSNGNRAYDTTGFENLVYASTAVGSATESAAERSRNQDTPNTGNRFGARTLPAAAETQAQYTQAYTQPSVAATNSPQYNTYAPQITRPASTDSSTSQSTSQSTSYSQRQTPVVTQQTLQNNRPNASRTTAPYQPQQPSGYGIQQSQPTPTQPSNGYTPRQTRAVTSRVNQTPQPSDRVAQAARACAHNQGYYSNAQTSASGVANPATSYHQTQRQISTSNRPASQTSNQRQAPVVSNQRQMASASHQRAPSTNSNSARSSPVTHQRQTSTAAPPNSAATEGQSNTASPLYRTSNPTLQPVATKSNLSQQSTNLNQQQTQPSNLLSPQVRGYQNTPHAYMNQQPQQSFSASNQTRNPRSLLSPTEASARAYQSRTTEADQQKETPEPQMQTVIDPRDLDLRPRPSPFAILEAAKLMREAEEREVAEVAASVAAAALFAKELAEKTSTNTSTQGPQNSNATNVNDVLSTTSNNQHGGASKATNGSIPASAHSSASTQNPKSDRQLQKQLASSNAPQASQSAPPNASQTSAPKRGPVVWPESKREALSAAAIAVLASFSENAGRTITKEQIHEILDEGPTYIEFCEMIEGIGFKMDRARLAKTLLSAVADENTVAAQSTSHANSKAKVSSRLNQNARTYAAQPPIDPQILGAVPGAIVSFTEPAIGPDGRNQIQWRPLENSNNSGVGQTFTGGEVVKKRRPHGKSAPVIGPDGLPMPPRPRGRPRRDGLPPIPRKSMPAMTNRDSTNASPSITNSHPLSAFAYQPSSSMQGRERWDSMNDKPSNFPYPDADAPPPIQESRDDIENRLLAALGDEGHHFDENQGQTRDFPNRDFQNGQSSAAPSSFSNKRSVKAITTHVAQDKINSTTSSQQQLPPPTPLTKEMAARKRDFAELIDLTLEDSDTAADASGPHKIRHDENAVENSNYGNRQGPRTIFGNLHGHPSPPEHHQHVGPANGAIAPGLQRQQHELLGTSSPQTSSRSSPNPFENFDELCKPIDNSLALRKSEYNPKSIARDVLIAVGRHPTERAINAHLEILKKTFPKQVGTRSDLSTFRWDIVDPGGLPIGSANMAPTEEEKSEKPKDKPPGLLASTSTPYRSPQIPSSEIPSAFKRPNSQKMPESLFSAFKRPVNTTPARPSQLRHEAVSPSEVASASPRRDRPPKDRSGESSKGPGSMHEGSVSNLTPQKPSSMQEGSISNPTPKKRGRPFKTPESAWRAAVKQQRLSTGELQPGRRGRPPKPLIEPTKLTDPKYVSFDCEWRDCQGELQNLQFLRDHIFNIHGHARSDGSFTCRWIDCGKDEVITDPESRESRTVHHDLTFSSLEKFKKHIEKKHLPEYAWTLGDGPKGTDLDGHESDMSYLSDANGRQVTPSIVDQEVVEQHIRPASLTEKVNKNGEPRKRIGRPPKNKSLNGENAEAGVSRDSSVAEKGDLA